MVLKPWLKTPLTYVMALVVIAGIGSAVVATNQPAHATYGACADADTVVSFMTGTDRTAPSNPEDGLVYDDQGLYYSLGNGGMITVGFFNKTIVDGPGNDIVVAEVGMVNGAEILVSSDGVTFVSLGTHVVDHEVRLDINPTGLTSVSYVKITDDNSGAGIATPTAGFNLDGVEALNCGDPEPTPTPTPTTPPASPNIDIEKYVRAAQSAQGDEVCETYGKPTLLTIRYTGDNNPTSHSQDDSKVNITGLTGNASPVRILVTDKENPTDNRAKVFHDANVALGETYEIDAALADENKLKAKTFVHVYDGNTLLQTAEFHTSCSQDLFIGDQFGSAELVGFLGESGEGATESTDEGELGEDADEPTGPMILVGNTVLWNYVVTNTGDTPLADVVVTDDQGVAVTCPADALGIGESMTCTASDAAQAGQYANIGTVIGTGAGEEVTDSDPAHYFGDVPVVEQCAEYGKPVLLTIRYTGDNNPTSHSQDDSKVNITGLTGNASPVRILVTDKENPTDNRAKVFHDANVALGETYEIDAALAGENKLKAKTFVHVYDGDTLLQTAEFHTSCSQDLFIGNQFGSAELVGFTGESS